MPDSVPAVSENTVVFSTEDLSSRRVLLLALNTENGNEIWRVEQKEANSSPSILDGKVILGGGDFFAYALDLKTGKEIWRSPVEDKFSVRNMPAIAFGDVFLADRIGNIYRLDGETGERKWIFRDTEGTMDQSFPVIAGKTLFIGSSAGNLYALDTDTGRLLWQDQVNGIVLSGAADSERFYFGVKFGDEGLYAYEHDPEGELEPTPGALRNLRGLIGGLILFALILVGVVLYARRRRRRATA
jgi:outer membrane protein assembly factor BamB